MVNYKIGIYKGKNGRIIDLDRIVKMKSLEKLDEFTMTFKSEEEFKLYLLKQYLIDKDELKHEISVSYNYGGKVKKMPVIYENMKSYFDKTNLWIELKRLSVSLEFLEKLANHYSIGNTKFNNQMINVLAIRTYISDARSNGGNNFECRALNIAIDDLYKKSLRKYDSKTGEIKPNYRGLRDLACFIYKYKSKLEKEKKLANLINESKEEWNQINIFDYQKQLEQTKSKINENINEEDYNQISIFDWQDSLKSQNKNGQLNEENLKHR